MRRTQFRPLLRVSSRLLVTAAAALVVVAAPLSVPAHAEGVAVRDRAGDSATGDLGDIRRVQVQHRARDLQVVVEIADAEHPDQYEVWIDTTPRVAGPDIVAYDYHGYEGDAEALFRVREWRTRDWGAQLRCSGLRMHRSREGGRARTTITVPRACLGAPRVVRIQAVTAQEHRVDDYAPGVRQPTRWLRAG